MAFLPRLLGALTAAYGVGLIARPQLLAEPCGLVDADGRLSDGVAVLSRALGARDAVSGLAMAVAPAGPALRLAIAVRVGCDLADAVGLGLTLPSRRARQKAATVAGLWGALCAASALTVRATGSGGGSRT
ncbi:hypothetical protein [Kutzneria buriramensis]|uniref:DUF4267 domain-containing protein n=1 Tax=Kutzneria buriramensis TaxID=1045776 RepID=A0A3E0GY80_9PSEU|nr:hypothetical protein [Kutzneria buriramensis]REH34898.1 hypothetical protein BCF44_119174 [Kutzneria buriramensis]